MAQSFTYKDCAPAELANAQVDSCIATAVSQTTTRPELPIAKERIESCMLGKGWTLVPIATVIESRRVLTCKDLYPLDRCPSELN